jgi:AcrR family transcriptional regulator
MVEGNWRERKKAQTRERLQEQALRLFVERGYEATTVEQIAAAAGVSHMTFFRYFPTKEDAVLSDSYDPMLVAAIRKPAAQRAPGDQDSPGGARGPGRDLRGGSGGVAGACSAVAADPGVAGTVVGEPVRHARPAGRRAGGREPSFATRILASVCLATLTTALEEWVATDGVAELPDLIDDAFQVLVEGQP